MNENLRLFAQISVFCAAIFTITVHAEQKSNAPFLPLIESQQSTAIQITGGSELITEMIPLGASKVTIEEPRHAVVYVWPTAESTFAFFLYDGSLDGIEQFDANLGFNWRFSRDNGAWKAERIQYESLYEAEFEYPYERLTRRNSVLTDIALFNESRMIECLQTRGSKFSKDANHSWTREEAISNFSGKIRGMGRNFMTKPGLEDIQACSPEMLTSLLYLGKESYEILYEVGLNQASKEENRLVNEENRLVNEENRLVNEENRLVNEENRLVNEEADRLTNILNKLSGQ
ncbi:hypothetical protein [Thiomicrospira sp. ALE5]|uniref:hypothetical protein n=1 Tax=Thiomicrospira sp. ALE5 TaxID=748650 RepID=UPI0008EE5002|nr:hypothetical protein [Thiomicrospira sp. ALE5]SFR54039.1 hypothetical protein SAMN03092900_0953 [Thiomicrospira sp. ALE5]